MLTTPRRLPSLLAGVLAMTASLSTLAAVVWSDIAEASQQPPASEYADELPAQPPVTMKPVAYPQTDFEALLEQLDERQLKRRAFGRFEGY